MASLRGWKGSWPWISAPLLVVLAGCGSPAVDESSVSVVQQNLDPSVATSLAHPEYDLNVETEWKWLPEASPQDIVDLSNQGYRVLSLDVVSASPLKLAATFVANTNAYSRQGNDFSADLTESQVLAIYADPARRIVSIAPYAASTTERHYAAVWISNAGSQQKDYEVVLHAAPAEFEQAVTSFNGRVVDLSAQPALCGSAPCAPSTSQFEVTAVMVKNVGVDQRQQWIGFGTPQNIGATLTQNAARIIDLDSPFGDGRLYFVAEKAGFDPKFNAARADERTVWVSDLFFNTMDNRAHPDSLAHAPTRFAARYGKLRGYSTPPNGDKRYAGVLFDNGVHPVSGTANAGNAVLQEIDNAVQALMKKWGNPGVVLAVSKDGYLVHTRGYGYSDLQALRVAEANDLYRLASVSKAICGMAILRLVQKGLITLDTKPFGQIFSYTPPTWPSPRLGDITIRHLLEHSIGLPPTSYDVNNASPSQWISIENSLGPSAPRVPPGTTAQYMNTNYVILTQIIEQRTGMSYEQYLKTEMLTPLGLSRIRVSHAVNEEDLPGIVQSVPYEVPIPSCHLFPRPINIPGERVRVTVDNYLLSSMEPWQGSTSMAASPVDLLRWSAALDGRRAGYRVIDDAQFASITSQVSPGITPTGFRLIFYSPGAGLLEKNGYIAGDTESILMLRSNGIKYAFMTNSDSLRCNNVMPQTPTHQIGSSFANELVAALENIFADPSKELPVRDCGDDGLGICGSCTDGVRSGNEGDVDCGGMCSACALGKSCRNAKDCASTNCDHGTCRLKSCANGLKDGDETGVDCGGSCDLCGADQPCSAGSDCRSGICTAQRCAIPATCSDHVLNAGETDVDCGGSCAGCNYTKHCRWNSDCQHGVCSDSDQLCQVPTCSDGVRNQYQETDVDCGGDMSEPTCPRCDAGKRCTQPGDCASASCVNGLCATAQFPVRVVGRRDWAAPSDLFFTTCPASTTGIGGGCLDLMGQQYWWSGLRSANPGNGFGCRFFTQPETAPYGFDGFAVCLANSADFGFKKVVQFNSPPLPIVKAKCPAGKTLIGGGCLDGSASTRLKASFPDAADQSWQCEFSNPSLSSATAYASCIDDTAALSKGVEVVQQTDAYYVECPAGKRVIGGGCADPSLYIQHSYPEFYPNSKGWNCRFTSGDTAGAPFSTNVGYAICANP